MNSDRAPQGWSLMLAVAVVLAAVLFLFPLLLGFPLLDPDEGLLASIAQEMVERDDWITPRLLGKPFLDKPIFFIWARALSLRAFGMSEAAVRLPGLLFGLLGMVSTGLVAWRMFGRPTGILAAMFYATLIVPTALAQAAMGDVALVPLVSLGLLTFYEADRAETARAATAWAGAAGMLLGVCCLTKGLAGVALTGVAYGGYLLATRRLTLGVCLRGAAAMALGAVVALPWYAAMEVRNPGYNYYYFVERHVLGFLSDTQLHGKQPWWYYLPVLFAGGLPWIAYLPVAVYDGWTRTRPPGAPTGGGATALPWCWLIGGTLFLSASRSKLVTYIWPVFPAVAILAAVVWARRIEGRLGPAARRLLAWIFCLSSLCGPVVLPVVLIVVQSKLQMEFSRRVWLTSFLAAGLAWVPLGFWIAGRLRSTLAAAVLSLAAQFAVIMMVVMPPVAENSSARELAGHFNRLGRLPPRLLIADERIGSLVFYLSPQLRASLREGQLQQVKLGDLPRTQPGAVIAVSRRRVRRASRHFDLDGLGYRAAGRYRLYAAGDLEPRRLAGVDRQTGTMRR